MFNIVRRIAMVLLVLHTAVWSLVPVFQDLIFQLFPIKLGEQHFNLVVIQYFGNATPTYYTTLYSEF